MLDLKIWKFFSFFFIVAMTSQPTNESELQLYRVLQRANLLSYYDTFICQGIYSLPSILIFRSLLTSHHFCVKPIKSNKLLLLFHYQVVMTSNNFAKRAKKSFWKLWHWLVWPVSLYMSADYKKRFRNGLQIQVCF